MKQNNYLINIQIGGDTMNMDKLAIKLAKRGWVSNAYNEYSYMKGTVFTYKTDNLFVEVHHQPGCGYAWFVTCKQLEIVSIALFEEDIYEAINKASKIVRDAIERLYIDAKKM